jgi:hypothetical protein
MSRADQATEVPGAMACESTWLHRPGPDELYVQFVKQPARRSSPLDGGANSAPLLGRLDGKVGPTARRAELAELR